jgi:tRNA nucleotidyltransferase (CCA-adding enzyme)
VPADGHAPRLSRGPLPRAVLEVCERLGSAGYRAWVVGGSVRDSLLDQIFAGAPAETWRAKDWDLATDATPEQVQPLFRRVIPTGIDHGTVTVLLHGQELELTTLRAERDYRDGRRPEHVDFVRSIEEDLARRDFTVNAIAFEPNTETLVDPFDGVSDLRARRLRAVGEAARRFAEDGLRVLRAARLVATLEFELDPDTARAIAPSLDTYRRVSAERIRDEWNKALLAPEPSRAFRVMHEHGMLAITAPELEGLALPAEADAEGEPHDGLALALARVDRCAREVELRLAALLRDVHVQPGRAAEMADALLVRLRYSNAERKLISHLIRNPLPPRHELATEASVRRWLRCIGPELHPAACQLERARLLALGAADAELQAVEKIEQRAEGELAKNPPLSLSALAIDGKRLMSDAGLRPGRQIGVILEALLERVLDDPSENEPERLLAHAKALAAASNPAP